MAIRAQRADLSISKENGIGAQWPEIVQRDYKGRLNPVYPSGSEVGEEVVDVHDVRPEASNVLDGRTPPAGRDTKCRAGTVERRPFHFVRPNVEQLNLMAAM